MKKSISYLALSAALLWSPAFAQEAPAAEAPAAEPAAVETPAPAPEAAPAVQPEAAAEAAPAAPAETPAPAVAAEAAAPAPEAVAPAAPAETVVAAAPADARVTAVPAGKAQIVFFRPSNFFGGGVSFTITEGETDVAKVTNGRYYIWVTEPGSHTYQVKSETTDSLTLELDEGETYYVKQTMDMGVVLYRPNMAPSDAAAFAALPKLKLAKPPKSKTKT